MPGDLVTIVGPLCLGKPTESRERREALCRFLFLADGKAPAGGGVISTDSALLRRARCSLGYRGVPEQVTNLPRTVNSKFASRHRNRRIRVAENEGPQGLRAVFRGLQENELAVGLANAPRLAAQCVLVEVDQFPVADIFFRRAEFLLVGRAAAGISKSLWRNELRRRTAFAGKLGGQCRKRAREPLNRCGTRS